MTLIVMTLQGCLATSHLEALEQSLGMTLSHMDLVFVWSGEKCSATRKTLVALMALLKGLIL